jgi:hypothetical protein
MDSTIKGSLIGAGAVLAGISISELLAWIRANRLRESERRSLAGALAAELRALLTRWDEVKPKAGQALPADIRWSSEEDYFPIYDGAGQLLSLLPRELAIETAACYMRIKVLLDKLRLVNQHCVARSSAPTASVRSVADTAITGGLADAVKYAAGAVDTAEDLVKNLDAVSAERSPATRFWHLCCRPWRWVWNRLFSWRRRPPEPARTG